MNSLIDTFSTNCIYYPIVDLPESPHLNGLDLVSCRCSQVNDLSMVLLVDTVIVSIVILLIPRVSNKTILSSELTREPDIDNVNDIYKLLQKEKKCTKGNQFSNGTHIILICPPINNNFCELIFALQTPKIYIQRNPKIQFKFAKQIVYGLWSKN